MAMMSSTALRCTLIALAVCSSSATWAHGIHGDQIGRLRFGSPLDYLWSGTTHMLTGYDHLMFLFGVMFFLTGLRDIVTFITAFTIGHSLTLIAATLLGVQANYFLVDAVIAMSVIYKGFDNLDGFRRWIGIEPPNLLGIVLAFGLIHGFGLATRLQSIGLPHDGLVPRLLAFNAGIEIGQVAALVVMTAMLAIVRRSHMVGPFTVIANGFLVIAGSLLFLMQMHCYLHTAFPDDFGFSSNQHIIDHFNNDIPAGDAASAPAPRPREQP